VVRCCPNKSAAIQSRHPTAALLFFRFIRYHERPSLLGWFGHPEGLGVEHVLSDRAQRFLQTFERRPHVEDLDVVRVAIEAAGLPVTEPVLDFHRTFAGYVVDVWGDRGPLGIVHAEVVAVESWFKPMKVAGYLTGKVPMLACADIHISWEMMIALDGTFYCNGPEASRYFLWTEQSAFMWDFTMTRPWRRLLFAAHVLDVAAILAPRLARCRIDELSDQHGQVYGTDRFVVSIGHEGGRCDVVIAEGEIPPEFADLQLYQP
jgi:hypothetical protein